MLPVGQLRPNDYNPNRMTKEEFAELVAEVKHLNRLPKPVVVRRQGDGYVIVDGEHGWRAAKEANLPEIPCEVIDADDFEAMRQTYKRNQHGTHEPVTLGRMFRRMLAERSLSGRALAEEIAVSEGTVRNAVMYADAYDLRNSYAPDSADEISRLSVRQVRWYARLPPRVAQLWLDSGGDMKTILGVKTDDDVRNSTYYETETMEYRTTEFQRLAETGLFEFVGRVHSADGFANAVKKVKAWDSWERTWTRHGVERQALRGYGRHYFKRNFKVREESMMDAAVGTILNLDAKPPAFVLSAEEFAEVLKLSDMGRESHCDFIDRLGLAVAGKTGQPPKGNRYMLKRELLVKQLESAPEYIRESKLSPEAKDALWQIEAPEEFKREVAARRHLPLEGGEKDGTVNGLRDCIRRLAGDWKRRTEQEQRVRALLAGYNELQIARGIAGWFAIYDKERDADAIEALAGKLAALTKAELVFLHQHAEGMEYMKGLAAAIRAMTGG
jgi:ParB/RepB/Spo0J family partition protein